MWISQKIVFVAMATSIFILISISGKMVIELKKFQDFDQIPEIFYVFARLLFVATFMNFLAVKLLWVAVLLLK